MFWYFLALGWAGTTLVSAQSCHFGSDCPQTATCCRNSQGEPLFHSSGFGHFGGGDIITDRAGQCTTQLSREHEVCDSQYCHCEPGYECYRPMSGVCCPPTAVITPPGCSNRGSTGRNVCQIRAVPCPPKRTRLNLDMMYDYLSS
uniref:Uncharacterized protein LOC111118243 n=1 Tax=Crassostrea virginica TaxID=6565 RepID=A0A8B8CC10_CRAVI|nr:uncharacterized protein LOC111118243 [Crassostrea virginica]